MKEGTKSSLTSQVQSQWSTKSDQMNCREEVPRNKQWEQIVQVNKKKRTYSNNIIIVHMNEMKK